MSDDDSGGPLDPSGPADPWAGRRTGRLPLLRPADLDDAQRSVHDAVAGSPRASGPFRVVDDEGRLLGPFNALLHCPAIGQAVQQVGGALRFGGALPARTRELVICTVAAHWGSEYEWYAHSRVAVQVGVSPAELDEVRAGQVPEPIDPADEAALRLTRALLRDRVVADETYAHARTHHGDAGVVELCVLVGYYQLLAGLLAAVDVGAPGDTAEPSPQTERTT